MGTGEQPTKELAPRLLLNGVCAALVCSNGFSALTATITWRSKEEASGFASFSNYGYATRALSILKGAKSDFENNYLFDTRALAQAEVFDDFLEQASHLLENEYYGPAAIIAGIVLEEGLRRLCRQNNVTLPARPTIGPMNDALAKTGLYGIVVKQRILALAAIRNQAAHGQWKEFTLKDVEQMIEWVKLFMENSFGNAQMSIQ